MPWVKVTETDMSEYKAVTDANIMSVGVVGALGRGPLNTVTKLTSATQFLNLFGTRQDNLGRVTWTAVSRLLANRMPVSLVRVAGENSASASLTLKASGDTTNVVKVDATSPGEWGNNVKVQISDVSGNAFFITVSKGATVLESARLSTLSTNNNYFARAKFVNVKLTDLSEGDGQILAELAATNLSGGANGDEPTDTEYVSGLEKFEDRFLNSVFYIAVFDNQTSAIQDAMITAAEARASATALLCAPAGSTETTTKEWFDGTGSGPTSVSSYAAAFGPWRYINDGVSRVLANPTLFYLEAVARSILSGNPIWLAIAGFKRGPVLNVSDAEFPVGEAVLNLWQPEGDGVSVNPILDTDSVGPVIYGNRTLQASGTALRSLNVRCGVNYIKNIILDVCLGLTFDQNETSLWEQFKGLVGAALMDMKNRKGIYDYQIQMDTGTVSPEDMDALRVPGMVRINPTRPGEYFDIGFVITASGVAFEQENIL